MFLSCTTLCEWLSIFLWVELTWLYVFEYYVLWVDLTRLCVIFILLYVFVVYNFVLWMSILVNVFVMHNFVRMTFNIIIDYRHAHLCTNDYPYSFGFSSCTSLYKWLSIFFWIFVMHISERMTMHIFLDLRHTHFCAWRKPLQKEYG